MATRRDMSEQQMRELRNRQHEARAAETYRKFIGRICENGHIDAEQAQEAAVAVIATLEERIIGEEARNLEAQLPLKLKSMLQGKPHHAGRPARKMDRRAFVDHVREQMGAGAPDAESAVRAVFQALCEQVTAGEIAKVVHELPEDLRDLWPEPVQQAVAAKHRAEAEHLRASNPMPQQPHAELRRGNSAADMRRELRERILSLPLDAQLGVIREVLPRVLGALGDDARDGFLRDLGDAIRGVREPAYAGIHGEERAGSETLH